MKSLSELKRRIESVSETQKITSAMETISVSKMRRALERYDGYNSYYAKLHTALNEVFKYVPWDNEFVLPREGKSLVIVIASDKGLCGSFNHDIFKAADALVTENSVVMPIGQMSVERYAKHNELIKDFAYVIYDPHYSDAKNIAAKVLELYSSEVSSIQIVYAKMLNHSSSVTDTVKLLPFESSGDEVKSEIEFYPSSAVLIPELINNYCVGMIYGALINTWAAEHCARYNAMSASSKNARDLLASLTSEYHRARQEMVTGEISEIAASASAISLTNKF